jgi:hypothetical protein
MDQYVSVIVQGVDLNGLVCIKKIYGSKVRCIIAVCRYKTYTVIQDEHEMFIFIVTPSKLQNLKIIQHFNMAPILWTPSVLAMVQTTVLPQTEVCIF